MKKTKKVSNKIAKIKKSDFNPIITSALPNGGYLLKYPNGSKCWLFYGNLHREDGPAVENIDGYKAWYLNGKQIPCTTQLQFERLMRLKAFW
jgi:hypothetical protein